MVLRADVPTIISSLAAAAHLQLLVTLEGLPSEPEPEAPTMTGDNQFLHKFFILVTFLFFISQAPRQTCACWQRWRACHRSQSQRGPP